MKEEIDSKSCGRIKNVQHSSRVKKQDLEKKIGKLHYSDIVFLPCHYFRNKSTMLITLYGFLAVNVKRGSWVRMSVATLIEQKRNRLKYKYNLRNKRQIEVNNVTKTLIKKKSSSSSIENSLLISYRFL